MFEKEGFFNAEEFWKMAGYTALDYRTYKDLEHPSKDFYSLTSLLDNKPEYVNFEGFLFPDTYFIPQNISPKGVIELMIKNLDEKITVKMREDIKESGKTFFDIIIMASILENEAITFKDKKIVSGLLWKRLEEGMPLQVDATLQYFTGKNTFQLTLEDLDLDSPYNTYEYKGLPLGPITNPGIWSIKAAIYPEESPYWFYLSDKESIIHYSETFEEHKAKKFKYL